MGNYNGNPGQTSFQSKTAVCPYCGMIHQAMCPKIKAYEYHPDGSVKRIEFFPPMYTPIIAGGVTGFQPIYPLLGRPVTDIEMA